MDTLNLPYQSLPRDVQVYFVAMLKQGGFISNLRSLCKYLANKGLRQQADSIRLVCQKNRKQKLLESLLRLGYSYEYVDPDGLPYITYTTQDKYLDWRFRSVLDRELIAKDIGVSPDLDEIFGSSLPCVNIYMRYTDRQIFRINLTNCTESEKSKLIRTIKGVGFFGQECQLYYHGALSYVFEINELVQIRKEPDEEEFDPDEIFTYRKAIILSSSFIEENYEELILDRSVFVIDDAAIGFYDCGVNIIPRNGSAGNLAETLEILGYTLNEQGFYEIRNAELS